MQNISMQPYRKMIKCEGMHSEWNARIPMDKSRNVGKVQLKYSWNLKDRWQVWAETCQTRAAFGDWPLQWTSLTFTLVPSSQQKAGKTSSFCSSVSSFEPVAAESNQNQEHSLTEVKMQFGTRCASGQQQKHSSGLTHLAFVSEL